MIALRASLSFLLAAVAGIGAGIVLALTVPVVFGDRPFTVLSGSMEPTIAAGDIVVTQPVAPLDAKVGDIVTFPDPNGGGRLVTHRLRSARARGGNAEMVTKGDANNTTESWTVPLNGRIGRVEYRVPAAGYLFAWVRGPFGRMLLVAIPALLLGAYELVRIWRPQAEPEEAANAAAA